MQLEAQQQHPVRQIQRQAQQSVLGGVSVASHQGQKRTPGGARELGADSLAWPPFPCESASRLPRLAARTLRNWEERRHDVARAKLGREEGAHNGCSVWDAQAQS